MLKVEVEEVSEKNLPELAKFFARQRPEQQALTQVSQLGRYQQGLLKFYRKAHELIFRKSCSTTPRMGVVDLSTNWGIPSGSPSGESELEAKLRWLLLENPARLADVPVGWVLRCGVGGIVGSLLCVPQRFFFGTTTYTILVSTVYFVDEPYRGLGLALLLRFLRLGAHHPLFALTANAQNGAPLWKTYGGCPIPYTNHELLGILRWQPVLEEVITRFAGGGMLQGLSIMGGPILALAHPLDVRVPRGAELRRLQSPEDVTYLNLAHGTEELTAVRDEDFIRWRYFSGHDPTIAVFCFRSEESRGDCLVAVNRRQRGHRAQIRVLNVLDVWGDIPPASMTTIAGLLARHYANEVDVLVFMCQDGQREACLKEVGFVRRDSPMPKGWYIDKQNILPTRNFYLVPADGDMGI